MIKIIGGKRINGKEGIDDFDQAAGRLGGIVIVTV
jgi:hypothetical protein